MPKTYYTGSRLLLSCWSRWVLEECSIGILFA
jgi:hypothetical protein